MYQPSKPLAQADQLSSWESDYLNDEKKNLAKLYRVNKPGNSM